MVLLALSKACAETVSNHGARARYVIKSKGLQKEYNFLSPGTLGGLKSDDYLRLNPQGKMPLLTTSDGLSIPESDVICRFLADKHISLAPTFVPSTLRGRLLSDLIVRIHDQYITPTQAALYRAPGSIFGAFGTDRKGAIEEIIKQLGVIEDLISDEKLWSGSSTSGIAGVYLCGDEISLADATLFPTLVFTEYMLPKFGFDTSPLFPRLKAYHNSISGGACQAGKEVYEEVLGGLKQWEENGRWEPILEEWRVMQ
ncbi:hypothetical protein TrRE_jg12129 [Triparma retinervis]|uniref:Glutathione S-transferase n=1 Tax=Triparma retinervis TaxID=2557542 RepID=A0A9W7ABH3_9STRA|nr:hypothetical protein TrRE_jg12129 [Triparma retinervis]